jgi:urea-proton symporter
MSLDAGVEDLDPQKLSSARGFVVRWGVGLTLVMLGLWPALTVPAGGLVS